MTNYYCSGCNKPVSKKRQPCPNCGSEKKDVRISVIDSISLHDRVSGKVKKNGYKRPTIELKKGDELYKALQEWRDVERIVDRSNDSYKEIIKDKRGNVVKLVTEPLRKHTGRGYAKPKKRKATPNTG